MTRLTFIAFFLFSACSFARGQSQIDTALIIQQVLREHADTGTIIFTDRVEPYFLNKTKEQITRKKLTGFVKKKPFNFRLTSVDKDRLLKFLNNSTKPFWLTNDILPNGKLISYDSLKSVTSYIDSSSLRKHLDNNKLIKVTTFSAPFLFDNGNKFIIFYGNWWMLPNGKFMQSVSHDITVYKKENKGWRRWLNVDGGITCN